MKKRLTIIALLILLPLMARAQDINEFIFDMPDDFSEVDTIPPSRKFKSIHMIGLQYGVNYSNVIATPYIGEEAVWTRNSVGIYYTYFHALWDHLFNFGLQFGAKYGKQGYASKYSEYGEICSVVEMPLLSKFKVDFSMFRLMLNIGPFVGYRLSTDKGGGFDKYDQRYAYGIMGGVGLAVVLKPVELHIEGNYQYSLGSMYHTYKYSDIYWLYAYPSNIAITASLHFHLW